jgi:hypothetical protein
MISLKSKLLEDKIKFILISEDPGGVFIKEVMNDDEYDYEIERIVQFLESHNSESKFIEDVNNFFLKMFGDTRKIAKYRETAKKIWFISKKEDQVKLL